MAFPTNPYRNEAQVLRCEIGTDGQVPTFQADGTLEPADATGGGTAPETVILHNNNVSQVLTANTYTRLDLPEIGNGTPDWLGFEDANIFSVTPGTYIVTLYVYGAPTTGSITGAANLACDVGVDGQPNPVGGYGQSAVIVDGVTTNITVTAVVSVSGSECFMYGSTKASYTESGNPTFDIQGASLTITKLS